MSGYDVPVLETPRLILRELQVADFEPLMEFMTDARSRFVRPGEVDRLAAWRAFGHVVGHWVLRGFGMWAITRKGEAGAIGMTGGWYPETWPEREIGWSLWDAGAEGQGIAFEAATAARAHLFGAMGWHGAVSYVDADNIRSARLAERLGCALDPDAPSPGGEPCLVYRHPAPDTDGSVEAYA